MNEKIFQNIYDEIAKYLINGWERLVVYLEYGNNSYSFAFYIKCEGIYIKCFDLPEVSEEELMNSFKNIDKIVGNERSQLKDAWSNMTMIVDDKGNMHTDYDYTDLSDGTYQFKKNWKQKYLI